MLKKCPKCGHELIDSATIGLNYGKEYCPANMPYQGCGWAKKFEGKKT